MNPTTPMPATHSPATLYILLDAVRCWAAARRRHRPAMAQLHLRLRLHRRLRRCLRLRLRGFRLHHTRLRRPCLRHFCVRLRRLCLGSRLCSRLHV